MSLYSYYLDASVGVEAFDELFRRAQSFAARALDRLNDKNDVEFARVFERIFKTSVTDPQPMARSTRFRPTDGGDRDHELRTVGYHVSRELHTFAYYWHRTESNEQAAVRIHGDGKQRYRLFDCTAATRILDPVNNTANFGSRASMEWMWHNVRAFTTSTSPWNSFFNRPFENPRRNVIDFTDDMQNNHTTWGHWAVASLCGRSVDSVNNYLLETTLIHEMMHCEAHGLWDFYTDLGHTAGWHLIMSLTKQESYVCAESLAMLCFAAALADLQPIDLPCGSRYTISSDGIIVPYSENAFVDHAFW